MPAFTSKNLRKLTRKLSRPFLGQSTDKYNSEEVTMMKVLGEKPKQLPYDTVPPSYFGPYVSYIHQSPYYAYLPLEDESILPPAFRTLMHSRWSSIETHWKRRPLEIDPTHILPPIIERTFRGVLFRLTPDPGRLKNTYGTPIFHKGSTLVFKNHIDPYARHIIEWCQFKSNGKAYLKVTGIIKDKKTGEVCYCPYNHLDYPSFLLVVPSQLSSVPSPPEDWAHLRILLRSISIPTFYFFYWTNTLETFLNASRPTQKKKRFFLLSPSISITFKLALDELSHTFFLFFLYIQAMYKDSYYRPILCDWTEDIRSIRKSPLMSRDQSEYPENSADLPAHSS